MRRATEKLGVSEEPREVCMAGVPFEKGASRVRKLSLEKDATTCWRPSEAPSGAWERRAGKWWMGGCSGQGTRDGSRICLELEVWGRGRVGW